MSYQIKLCVVIKLVVLLCAQLALAAPPEKNSLVTVTEVVKKDLRETLLLSGTAEALMDSDISARVDGVVETLSVDEGQWVKKGQKLLQLDSVITQLEMTATKARVSEAEARHKDAIRQKKELESLQKSKAVAKSALSLAIADEEAARAALAREKAELQRHEELLARHTLTAPFTGVVAHEYVEVGEWVKSDTPVIKLLAQDTLRIRAALPQRYYAQLTQGAQARIVFDALPDNTYFGDITALLALGDERTRTFPLLIDIDNTKHILAAGMSARVYVELKDRQSQVLMLPRDALVQKPDGSRIVWKVLEQDDKLIVNSIKLHVGRTQGDLVEVLDSSLKAGDRVVMLGNENLRPNQVVLIKDQRQ